MIAFIYEMMCMIYESYRIGCIDIVCIIYIYFVLRRKGPVMHGRSAKTVLYTYIRRKGPVLHGRSAKTVLYTYIRRKGPVLHGRSAKTVLWYTYICIFTNDWEWMAMCDTYVCVTLGVCWIVYDNENIRIQI